MDRDNGIENRGDLLLGPQTPSEHWHALRAERAGAERSLWLLIVPEMTHPLVCMADQESGPVAIAKILPDMADDDRRTVAIALRNGEVDLLFVTPERLEQDKFLQFMGGLSLGALVIVDSHRMWSEAPDHIPAYARLSTIRKILPNTSLIALWAGESGRNMAPRLAAMLSLRIAPQQGAVPAENSAIAPPMQHPPAIPRPAPPSVAGWERARPHFEEKEPLDVVMTALGEPMTWCVDALVAFIRQSGRSNPFPWVAQPAYMAVAMAAGQTESTNTRLVMGALQTEIAESEVRICLAALENRAQMAPGNRPRG